MFVELIIHAVNILVFADYAPVPGGVIMEDDPILTPLYNIMDLFHNCIYIPDLELIGLGLESPITNYALNKCAAV